MIKLALAAAAVTFACTGMACAQSVQRGHDTASHGYEAPALESLGGEITLRDVAGHAVTSANLHGGWRFVYFGYSRCRSACPIALPTLDDAAARLRANGLDARAVFIDVDASATPLHMRSQDGSGEMGSMHSHVSMDEQTALATLAQQFPLILFLTGSRLQVRHAVEAFHVRAEHMPPRTDLGEMGHSINHTSLIYVLDPQGTVAGYYYHDVRPEVLSAFVAERAQAH